MSSKSRSAAPPDRRAPEFHLVVVFLALGLAPTAADSGVEVGRYEKGQLGELRPIAHDRSDALGHAIEQRVDVVDVFGLPPPVGAVGEGGVPLDAAIGVTRANRARAMRRVSLEQLIAQSSKLRAVEPRHGRMVSKPELSRSCGIRWSS